MNLEFSGSTPYIYSGEPAGKLTLGVEIDGIRITAVVDTGAPYMICEPEIAEQLDLKRGESLGDCELRTHLGLVDGCLYRMSLTLLAASPGASATLEVTLFVPRAELWKDNPSFLGFHGCLERIRFAIDPATDNFYFGSLSNNPR